MQKRRYRKSKRLRVFAGPNGSGKTTILNQIGSKFDIGFYINADLIEQELKTNGKIELKEYGINQIDKKWFDKFIKSHSIISKAESEGYEIDVDLDGNNITNPNAQTHSYEASLIADILRQNLLELGKKITFETVMSHDSKLEFLKKSQKQGYKNYLYYISTESPLINIERVNQRVKLGGHPVQESKIESRYFKSLSLLKDAVKLTYRTFIFDNSESEANLILEIFKGEEVFFKHPEIPKWVDRYLLR